MQKSRTQKAIINMISSIGGELITIACGLILPRLILSNFGSAYNGIVQSVSQFISCISLMKAGIGGATRSALYKPLANNDVREINEVIASTEKFMHRVSMMFVLFVACFSLIYPLFICKDFDIVFSATLIVIVSISTFVEYYFGFSYEMLLMADQKEYITTTIKMLSTILNTVVAVILINNNFSIHIVKLGSSLVACIMPLFVLLYCKNRYSIKKVDNSKMEKLPQRWDAVAHEVASFVNDNTDIMVLTFFSGLLEVSVYTVYHYVTVNLRKAIKAISANFAGAFGNMYANKEFDVLKQNLAIYELIVNTAVSIVHSTTLVMIVPFIMLYTKGVTDVDYFRPTFAIIITVASAFDCFRLPYRTVVTAAGHFKQTRNGAILEAIINIVLSVVLVIRHGIIGVSIGTLCAMMFRTCQYAIYLSNKLIDRNILCFIKHIGLSLFTMLFVYLISRLYICDIESYYMWIVYSIITVAIASVITIMIDVIFYKNDTKVMLKKVKHTILKKKHA